MRILGIHAPRCYALRAYPISSALYRPRAAAVLACTLLAAGCLGPTAKDDTPPNNVAMGQGAFDIPAADSDRCPSFPPQLRPGLPDIAQSAKQHAPQEKQETPQTRTNGFEIRRDALRKTEEIHKELERAREEQERIRKHFEKLLGRMGRTELLPLWPRASPPEVWIDDKSPNDTPPQWLPNIVGKVLKVTGDGGIEISLGSDNGLKQGCRVDVYRTVDGTLKYVGRVQVTEVGHERATGKMIPEFRKGEIQDGDHVATLRP